MSLQKEASRIMHRMMMDLFQFTMTKGCGKAEIASDPNKIKSLVQVRINKSSKIIFTEHKGNLVLIKFFESFWGP